MEFKSFEELFMDETKNGVKIPTSGYLKKGKNIIVDQGQTKIAGFTDMEDGVFKEIPAILFGDHTRVIKYVDEPFFLGADGVKVLRGKEKNANYKYLYYALKNIKIPNTGYNRHFKWLKEAKLRYPDNNTQEKIVNILDELTYIIQKRNEEIKLLDNLIKARFIEMFGDPQINQFNWNKVNISNVIKGKVSNGYFAKRDEYCDDGNVNVLGVANVVNCMYSNVVDLPSTNASEKDISKFKVQYGDMLFCRSSLVAEGIGKASTVPKNVNDNILFECHVIRLPLDLSQCIPEFMQVLSTTDFFRNQVIAQSKTATMTTIGQDGILKTSIILPPIELQKKFEFFVQQVDQSKFHYFFVNKNDIRRYRLLLNHESYESHYQSHHSCSFVFF